jgi:hypothetical protein
MKLYLFAVQTPPPYHFTSFIREYFCKGEGYVYR